MKTTSFFLVAIVYATLTFSQNVIMGFTQKNPKHIPILTEIPETTAPSFVDDFSGKTIFKPKLPQIEIPNPNIGHQSKHQNTKAEHLKLDSLTSYWYKNHFWYNEHKDVVLNKYYYRIDGQYYLVSQTENNYDANYRLIQSVNSYGDQYYFDFSDKTIYQYDDNDRKIVEEFYIWGGVDWEKQYQHSYTYDQNGNVIVFERKVGVNNQWENNQKNFYIYNSANLVTSIEVYLWLDQTWKKSLKEIFEYNEYSDITKYVYYQAFDDEWIPSYKYECSFLFDTHKEILYSAYSWDANMWKKGYQYQYYYNQNQLDTCYIERNGVYNDWVNQKKVSKSYDANNNLITQTTFNWISDNWANYNRYIYTYNANNLKITSIYQTWDDVNQTWNNYEKIDYEYNIYNRITLIAVFQYYNNQWNNKTRIENNYYNDTDLKTLEAYKIWDNINNQWNYNYKYEREFNQYNDIISFYYYTGSGPNWAPFSKIYFTYNNSLLFSDAVIPEGLFISIPTYSPLTEYYYNFVTKDWQPVDTLQYYYSSGQFLNTNSTITPNTIVFPNPARDQINIINSDAYYNQQFILFDINGKIQYSQSITSSTINLPRLADGIYFFTLGKQTGKLLIKH